MLHVHIVHIIQLRLKNTNFNLRFAIIVFTYLLMITYSLLIYILQQVLLDSKKNIVAKQFRKENVSFTCVIIQNLNKLFCQNSNSFVCVFPLRFIIIMYWKQHTKPYLHILMKHANAHSAIVTTLSNETIQGIRSIIK